MSFPWQVFAGSTSGWGTPSASQMTMHCRRRYRISHLFRPFLVVQHIGVTPTCRVGRLPDFDDDHLDIGG
jgi:hypothetical protein